MLGFPNDADYGRSARNTGLYLCFIADGIARRGARGNAADRRPAYVSGRSRVQETGVRNAAYGADKFGFAKLAGVNWNLTEAPLYEHAIRNGEASIVAGGA